MRKWIEDVKSELDVGLDAANRRLTAPAERWAAGPENSAGTA
ncbi:hypothetical protein ACFWVU_29160 [Streptomyces sp. NPDC058686]